MTYRNRSAVTLALAAGLVAMPLISGFSPLPSVLPSSVLPSSVLPSQSTAALPIQMAQAPKLPFPLDGKPVYVKRGNSWLEARLVGYRWDSQSGFRYDVQYVGNSATERGVGVDRILSLADAQKRGIAKAVYDVSSTTGIQQMADAHNQWRKRYNVPALTWSPQLATYAQAWATKLLRENRFEHRPNGSYGENLASASGQQLSPAQVVNLWGSEDKDYNAATNSCRAGKVCGHFTQVVWRSTKQVGCGMARGNGKEVWVCNYNPPGNFVGQKPF